MNPHTILLAVVCATLLIVCTLGYSVYKQESSASFIHWSRMFYTIQGVCVSLPIIAFSSPIDEVTKTTLIISGAVATLAYPAYNLVKTITNKVQKLPKTNDTNFIPNTVSHAIGLVIGIVIAIMVHQMLKPEELPKQKNSIIQFIILLSSLFLVSLVLGYSLYYTTIENPQQT